VDGDDALVAVLERSRDLGFLGPGPVERHVEHAAAFAAAVVAPPVRALDLGAGGGVPGLVLARRWPDSGWTLLDAQARRCTFLVDAVAELGLDDRVEVVHGRAEVAGREVGRRAAYDLVVARSFAAPAVTAECGAAFLQVGGTLVVAEPPDADPARWPADGLAGFGLEDDGVVRQAGASVRRLTLVRPLDERFPRRDGMPAKRPLF